jgi:hypothetical protein
LAAVILADTAALVRCAYVTCYRETKLATTGAESDWGVRPIARWDGGDTDTATYQPIWPRIAQQCLDNQAEPVAFVQAQFASAPGALPTPQHLLGPVSLQCYRDMAAKLGKRMQVAHRTQLDIFRFEVKWRVLRGGAETNAARAVLRDQSIGLSGLFRYCAATAAGDAEIADLWRDAALAQYVFQRGAYDATWGEFIPAALRADAEALLTAIKGRHHG